MLVLFGDGDQVVVTTEAEAVRFLLVSGRPIGEPVAWYGPIVMNTDEELEVAFEEYRNGTFIKPRGLNRAPGKKIRADTQVRPYNTSGFQVTRFICPFSRQIQPSYPVSLDMAY